MRKGFILTLMVAALVMSASMAADAASPILDPIPNIVVSDFENTIGTVDSNLFVFTDAFDFDMYVADIDNADADIVWSWTNDPLLDVGAFSVNGIGPLTGLDDPLAPPADLRGVSNLATFREETLSPSGGTSPFIWPGLVRGASTVIIPGLGSTDNVYSEVAMTFFASDGDTFDMSDTMAYAVDTYPGQVDAVPDQLTSGIPTLTFTPASLAGWTFVPGDGTFTAATVGDDSGGSLDISFPAATPTTVLTLYTGIWQNGTLADFIFAANMVYGVRANLSQDVDSRGGSQNRLRAEALTSSIDFGWNNNAAADAATTPFQPTVAGRDFLAYFAPHASDTLGQHNAAFDGVDLGGATARNSSATTFEIAAGDVAQFFGAGNAVAGATFMSGDFASWSFLNFGTLTAGGFTFFNGANITSGGSPTSLNISDGDTGEGGVGSWSYVAADAFEVVAGATYHTAYDVNSDDGADDDGTYLRYRLRTGSESPALSVEYEVRGATTAPLQAALGDGATGTHNLLWVGNDFAGAAGVGNLNDDWNVNFELVNFGGTPGVIDGTIDLLEVRTEEVSSDDPNVM